MKIEGELAPAKRTNLALHAILRQVMRDLEDGHSVTIKRADEHAIEVRFEPSDTTRGYRVTARHWIDQTPTIARPSPTSARGTLGPYVGWSPQWSAFMGFNTESVLATDWRFV